MNNFNGFRGYNRPRMANPNEVIQNIANAKNNGANPQIFLQQLMQRNPNYNQQIEIIKNMAQGRTPQEFMLQLAKQQGLNEESINTIKNMF